MNQSIEQNVVSDFSTMDILTHFSKFDGERGDIIIHAGLCYKNVKKHSIQWQNRDPTLTSF